MDRARRVLRAAASMARHPSRVTQWRRYLSQAWRLPSERRSATGIARPVPCEGPPVRQVRAAVDGPPTWLTALAPEWQILPASHPDLSDVDIALVVWDGTPDAPSGDGLLSRARAAGVPTLLWDVADLQAPLSPDVASVDTVCVSRAERAGAYTHPAITVIADGIQPRDHHPARTRGRTVPYAHLTGTAGSPTTATTHDSVMDDLGPLLGRIQRPGDLHDVVAVTGRVTAAQERRVLELIAEGTVIVASDGDLARRVPGVIHVRESDEALAVLTALGNHAELRRRAVTIGTRSVLAERSLTAAVDHMLHDLGLSGGRRARPVSAVVPTMRPDQIRHVVTQVAAQSHPDVELVLVTHGFDPDAGVSAHARELGLRTRLITAPADLSLGAVMNLGIDAADGEYVAKMDDDNHYGPHYLADLLSTFDFSGAQIAGKWAHFAFMRATGATMLRFPAAENRHTRLVQGGTLTAPTEVLKQTPFQDLPRRIDTTLLEAIHAQGGLVYSADRYNFVSVRAAGVSGHTWQITDSQLLAKPSSSLVFAEPWNHVDV